LATTEPSLIRLFPASYFSREAIILVPVLIRVSQICCADAVPTDCFAVTSAFAHVLREKPVSTFPGHALEL